MGTNDKETRCFFKHLSGKVILCPRSAGKGHSWSKKQKTVIVDADAGNYRRRIMAFVGEGSTTSLPREPWHDLHSRIGGPAPYHVLKNFEERWLRASKLHRIQKMKKTVDDSLLKLERIPDILGIDEAHCTSEQDHESWHVQVFRSIDSNSVKGFPKDPMEATSKNLVCGKNVLIDTSIHTAYVKAIRSAQHFIKEKGKSVRKWEGKSVEKSLTDSSFQLDDLFPYTALAEKHERHDGFDYSQANAIYSNESRANHARWFTPKPRKHRTNGTTPICVQARRNGQLPLSKQWVSQQAAAAVAAIGAAKIQATLIRRIREMSQSLSSNVPDNSPEQEAATGHSIPRRLESPTSQTIQLPKLELTLTPATGREHSQEINNLSVPALILQASGPSRKRSRSPSSPFFPDAITFSDGKPASETSELNPEDVTTRIKDLEVEIDTLHADTEDKELLISELQDSLAAAKNEIAMLQIRVADAEDRRAKDHDQIQNFLARLGL
ncbi:phospholipase D gamma 1 [Tanacetum coccineum]